MKILILNPLIYGKKKSLMNTRKRQPLSLAYIASLLRAKHQIIFLDANALDYGAEQTVARIKNNQPDILILTSTPVDRWECPNSQIDSIFQIINQVKIENTILTGSHGTVTPDWIFEKCEVKYIVRGEPELTVLNLVEALSNNQKVKNVKGISFKIKGEIVHNEAASRIENLDQLPLPAYDLLPMEKYKYSFDDLPQPFSIMLTSRGCPFNCIYCLKAMLEGRYIARSPESVITEIKYLTENFGIKSIFFQDWEFTIIKERAEKICDLILENKLKFKWGCNSRANDISTKLAEKMKQAGCVRVNIGFESANQKILDNLKKGIKTEDLTKAVEICRGEGIKIGLYGFLNAPGENRKTIKETVDFLNKHKIKSVYLNLPIPYFSTELFERLKKQKKADFSWDNIEKYAGKVNVRCHPYLAKFWQQYYKFICKKF
ncbi:MAG: Radical SAM protein [Parcubacteria group bacterium Athens1014_10]|nr:MAG: Radical SAM protein [Parcubacteria group bacterium Athens1014_10]TSD05552.1 MAG: Radical SAM protein [Parcubacteria group bacterium Athens0714_12]